MRAADGRWVWLRKRAEIVEDEETGAREPRRHCLRRHRAQAGSGAVGDRRPAPARRDRGDFRGLRPVGLGRPARALQLEISKPAQSCRRGGAPRRALPRRLPRRATRRSPAARPWAPLATAPFAANRAPTRRAWPDGRWLQVNERRTRDGGYVSVGADITALKEHEEQLVNSERLLLATVAQLKQSRRSLEEQAQQLADLAEALSRAEIAGRSRQPRQGGVSRQHEP